MVSKDMSGILASSFSSKEKVVLNETKQKKKKKRPRNNPSPCDTVDSFN